MKSKQLQLFTDQINVEFGGSLLLGKRKGRRPLHTKKPTHLVFKATNPFYLLRNKPEVKRVLEHYARRFNIKIYEVGVHADHIHIAITIPRRILYTRWIRAVTSVLVQRLKGLKWRLRPYSRIAAWGRQFENLIYYIRFNEAEGNLYIEAHERASQLAVPPRLRRGNWVEVSAST